MTAITETVRDRSFAPLECDIPPEMTMDEYRARKPQPASRWEKARVGILGAGLVGLVAETLLRSRASR